MSEIQLDPMAVGKAISRIRQKRGITQEVLSGLADLGRTHLSAIERGKRKPTLETIWHISSALGIQPHELVHEIEKELERFEPCIYP